MHFVLCAEPLDIRKPGPTFAREVAAIERLRLPYESGILPGLLVHLFAHHPLALFDKDIKQIVT
jgi:hypothetical protein